MRGRLALRIERIVSRLVAVLRRSHPVLLLALPTVLIVVGAWLHRWVAEDAFIDFRVVQNIWHGHGPVFNVGQRVEVYTDPLWVAALALVGAVLPFISIEWWSVILGLVGTGVGFICATAAIRRLSRQDVGEGRLVVPVGLVMVSSVAIMWDFATSGLETGMIFGWIGLTWWLLVRSFEGVTSTRLSALVASLGFTIRPDMALITAVLVVTLWLIDGADAPRPTKRQRIVFLVAATAIPLASELFRVAYFGLLTSNTAIAKSASHLWLGQGLTYLWDFLSTYWILIPLVAVSVLVLPRWYALWVQHERLRLLVMVAPAIGGLADSAFVVAIGGDFMHGRMLLPGFFSLGAVTWCVVRRDRVQAIALGGAAVWSLWSLWGFRYDAGPSDVKESGIANERSYWIARAEHPHPVTLADYKAWVDLKALVPMNDGRLLTRLGIAQQAIDQKRQILIMNGELFTVSAPQYPSVLFVADGNIGISGYALPDSVHMVDMLSLASPLSSHFALTERGRPGHEKEGSPPWVLAMYAPRYDRYNDIYFHGQIPAATKALRCWPMAGYLKNISSPLSANLFWSNIAHSVTWSTMSFPADPVKAERQLCGGN